MQDCPTIGAWHGYNWNHPTRCIHVYHNIVAPCNCTTVKRDPECSVGEMGNVEMPFAAFCRGLGFDPRLPVYEIHDRLSSNDQPMLRGSLSLVNAVDNHEKYVLSDAARYIDKGLTYTRRTRAFRNALSVMDSRDPFMRAETCKTTMEVQLKGDINPPVAFLQAPIRYADTPEAAAFNAQVQERKAASEEAYERVVQQQQMRSEKRPRRE